MSLGYRLIGKAARLWWKIRRPRTLGVRALVVDSAGRIVLIRHSYVGGWHMPGGGVDKGESFERAAHRELREETGITDAAIERVLGVYHSRKEGKDDHIVVYVMRVGAVEARAADAREIEEAGWFAVDGLPDGVSAATLRRIEEYRAGTTGSGTW
jgi:ADP-ribose pyrophosphatase YjhB (NUDIX family)